MPTLRGMRKRVQTYAATLLKARKRHFDLATIIELGGFAAFTYGAGTVYEPAGWLVGGLLAWWAAQGMSE